MNHHDWIDLSFIPRLLDRANGHLDNATTALKAEERDRELVQAGLATCKALWELYDHPRLWGCLRAQRQQHLRQWQTLDIPQTVAEAFTALGYHAQPPAEKLVEFGNDALEEAVTAAIVDARETIRLLHDEIKDLTESKRAFYERRNKIRLAGKALATVFTAALVIPEVQAGLEHLLPEVAAKVQDLLERVDAPWAVLSVGLAVIPTEQFRGPLGPYDQPVTPTTPGPETQPRGVTPATADIPDAKGESGSQQPAGDHGRGILGSDPTVAIDDERRALIETFSQMDLDQQREILEYLEGFKESEVVVGTKIAGTPANPNWHQPGQPPQGGAPSY